MALCCQTALFSEAAAGCLGKKHRLAVLGTARAARILLIGAMLMLMVMCRYRTKTTRISVSPTMMYVK